MAVAPGSGWPTDPATPDTPVAGSSLEVAALASWCATLDELSARVSVCRACPRLVEWREAIAVNRRRAFADETYWGRPVAGFGDPRPFLLVLGLAPAAHGANRTGRNFTGDRSGDFLYAALHRAGLANRAVSSHAGDGLELFGTRIVPAVRCAPPANKPTPEERRTCEPWLVREIQFAWPTVRSVMVLGAFAWAALWPALRSGGLYSGPAVPFGHGAEVALPDGRRILGCYHVSQQNTFTGRLAPPMIDEVLRRAIG